MSAVFLLELGPQLRLKAYAASKAALEAMTRVWATELGQSYGVTVNAINPGPVKSDMWDGTTEEFKNGFPVEQTAVAARIATPEDIAGIVVSICDRSMAWCSGDVINANGGFLY